MFHMITPEQTFVNGPLRKISLAAVSESIRSVIYISLLKTICLFSSFDFKLLISDQHQVFGRMSGKAVLDDGRPIEFRDILCFAEKVHNRY